MIFSHSIKKTLLCAALMLCAFSLHAVQPTVTTIPAGDSPSGIAITPNGKYAYVANNNNDGLANGSSVTLIDLKTNMVQKTIEDTSFNQPYTVTISPDGSKAYVTNSNSTTISIIDTAQNRVVEVIDGFDGPSGLAITSDGKTGYVNNYGGPEGLGSGYGHTISVVDLVKNVIVRTIGVDLAPAALALTSDDAFLYIANYVDGNPGTGTVNVVVTGSGTIAATIPGFSGPFSLVITPNDKFVYVTNFGSNNFFPYGTTVSVIATATNTIVDTIELGIQPAGIAVTPDGRSVYVSNYNTLYFGPDFSDLTPGLGTVQIINTATNKVNDNVVVVGSSPAGIAITPNGRYVYVTNYNSKNVSEFNVERMWLLS